MARFWKRDSENEENPIELDEEGKQIAKELVWPVIEKRLMTQREMARRRMETYLHEIGNQIVHYADFIVKKEAMSGIRLDYVAIRDIENDHIQITIDIRIKPDSQKLFGVPE